MVQCVPQVGSCSIEQPRRMRKVCFLFEGAGGRLGASRRSSKSSISTLTAMLLACGSDEFDILQYLSRWSLYSSVRSCVRASSRRASHRDRRAADPGVRFTEMIGPSSQEFVLCLNDQPSSYDNIVVTMRRAFANLRQWAREQFLQSNRLFSQCGK